MGSGVVRVEDVLSGIDELWAPHRIAAVNDYDVKIVKVHGDFVEHTHSDTDEFFLVLSGELFIDLPDGPVRLGPHDVYVVPQGVRHRPHADVETSVLLFEPAGVINTGDAGGPMTRAAVDA
jgi:mannose-6-phosphate isomerase-like protein (cupin superfamily)